MEELHEINTWLQRIPQPAFRVENGVITHVNRAATAYGIEAGESFAVRILSGSQEYGDFSAGDLYLTLSLAGLSVGAHVSPLDNGQLVTLEQPAQSPQLQALALAAKTLKKPLGELLAIADQMSAPAAEHAGQENRTARLNQQLYKMLRILDNMSDAAGYVQAQPSQMETVEICGFLEEILEKASTLLQDTATIRWELPNNPVFTLADREKLERAIHNLLSNALKSATPATAVCVRLVRKQNRLYLSVSNTHPDPGPQSNLFNRYLRNPAELEDPRNGLGLGMVIVCATAALHGGAVLIDRTADGSRFTMTLQIRKGKPDQLSSPVLHWDYAGEYDHCLLELADVLPTSAYHPDQLQ